MVDRKVLKAIPIILTPIAFAVVIVFNALAGQGNNAIFKNSVGNLSDKYYLEITPAGWTFSIWGFIYTWQGLWIVYGLITLCLNGTDNEKLYYSPEIIPIVIYMIYMFNLACNVGWLIFWDREWLVAAFFAIAALPVTLDICIALSARSLNNMYNTLLKHGLGKHIWLVRLLLQNGLGIYATWVTIASLLNLGITLSYKGNMDQKDASTVCLSILSLIIIGWFLLDILLLDKWVRYLFIPYFVVVFAVAGVLAKNYVKGERNSIFTVVIEVVASLELVGKMLVLFYRHVHYPEPSPDNESMKMKEPVVYHI